jgi:hypothetical protein
LHGRAEKQKIKKNILNKFVRNKRRNLKNDNLFFKNLSLKKVVNLRKIMKKMKKIFTTRNKMFKKYKKL